MAVQKQLNVYWSGILRGIQVIALAVYFIIFKLKGEIMIIIMIIAVTLVVIKVSYRRLNQPFLTRPDSNACGQNTACLIYLYDCHTNLIFLDDWLKT